MTYFQRKLLHRPFPFVIIFSWKEGSQQTVEFVPALISELYNYEKWKDRVGFVG